MQGPETNPSPPRSLWPEILWSGLGLVLVFGWAARAGLGPASRGERVLPFLDTLAKAVGAGGSALTVWVVKNLAPTLGVALGVIAFVSVVGLLRARKRALPLLLMGVSVGLVTCGQVNLLARHVGQGKMLYLAAVVAALVLGVLYPVPASAVSGRVRRGVDGLLALGLGCLGLATRLWALTELPAIFIGEMSEAMLSSRTMAGMHSFAPGALLGTSIGFVHMFLQMLFFRLFGTSFYSLRLTAVAMGVAAVFAMYWLLRSLAGRRAAVIGTLLLVVAPEQLWWSRSENTNFIAVPLMGILGVALGLWLRRTLSWRAALANTLWLPFGRFFYLAAVTMVTYPWFVVGHALLFGRGLRRRLWAVVPILAVGTALWVLSLSIANLVLGGVPRFLNPAHHGEMVTTRTAEGRGANWAGLVKLQAESLGRNLTHVARSMAHKGGFSQWYQRVDEMRRSTWINSALAAAIAVSVFFLMGQAYRPEAGLLLGWLVVGILPAVLSSAPDDRRMALAFPAMYACVAFSADGLLRVVREACGRATGLLASLAVLTGLAAIGWSSLASHLRMPVAEPPIAHAQRQSEEVFRSSEAIYYDFDPPSMLLLVLGNADTLLRNPPCIEFVGPRDWLDVALRQSCRFDDAALRISFPEEKLRELKASYRPPREVSFLVSTSFRSKPALRLLKALFPRAAQRPMLTADDGSSFTAVTVPAESLQYRRTAVLRTPPAVPVPPGIEKSLLANAPVRREIRPELTGAVLAGGLLVRSEDWYSARLSPACAGAELRIDGQPVTDESFDLPLMPGVHALEVRLPDLAACSAPMSLELRGRYVEGGGWVPGIVVSPDVAELPEARPQEIALFPGYEDMGRIEGVRGVVQSMRASPEGRLLLLTAEGQQFFLQHFDAEGRLERTLPLPLAPGVVAQYLAAGRAGQALVTTNDGVRWFDVDGNELVHWPQRTLQHGSVGFLRDGRVLVAVPEHAAVEVFTREGQRESAFAEFGAAPGVFLEPVTVALGDTGDLLVGQTNGDMLLFRTPLDRLAPEWVRQFHMDFTFPSVMPRSLTFDGPERILAGDPERERVFVHNREGVRLLAEDSQYDWLTHARRLGEVRFLASTPQYLFALGGDPVPHRFRRR